MSQADRDAQTQSSTEAATQEASSSLFAALRSTALRTSDSILAVHRRTEEQLRESERRYRYLSEAIDTQLFGMRANGQLVFVNQAMLRYFGCDPRQLPAWLATLAHPDDAPAAAERLRDGLDAGPPIEIELRLRRGDGEYRWHVLRASSTADTEGAERYWYGSIFDIEDLRRAESATERATELAQARSAFLAAMSHEIRTPLHAVISMAGLLAETRLDTEQSGYAQVIANSGRHLLAIINDILDYSKLESGAVKLECTPFRLAGVIEEALELVAPIARENRVDICYRVRADAPAKVLGDAGRVRQVLVNYLSNAAKFAPGGEVEVVVESGSINAQAVEIRVEVRDDGPGIDPAAQARLFQRFTQVDDSMQRRHGGTGLGLAISKRLTELMNGRVWLRSAPGDGACFGFSFQAQPLADETPALPRAALTGRSAWLVDPRVQHRSVLRELCTALGLQVREAADVSALQAWSARGERADLLLLNPPPTWPVTRVHEFLQQPDLPQRRLVLSAHQLPSAAGAVLLKPLRHGTLADAVLRLFDPGRASPSPMAPASSLPADLARRHPLRILVAEDNPTNVRVIQILLQKMGYAPDVVEDGVHALEAQRRAPYDLILMDVQMPGMDGVEAARRIRAGEAGPSQPRIAALTAGALAAERQRCFDAGMDDFLGKPLEVSELIGVLQRCAVPASSV